MITPDKYIPIQDGTIAVFNEIASINSKDIFVALVDNELSILFSGYCIPIKYLNIKDAKGKFTLFICAADEITSKEARILAEIPLADRFIGKIMAISELNDYSASATANH